VKRYGPSPSGPGDELIRLYDHLARAVEKFVATVEKYLGPTLVMVRRG
jgi:hypothetical protein